MTTRKVTMFFFVSCAAAANCRVCSGVVRVTTRNFVFIFHSPAFLLSSL